MLISRLLSEGHPYLMDSDIATGGDGDNDSAPDTGTPDESLSGPDGTPAEGETHGENIDYEQRYNDLRPEFDRKSQEAAEYRQFQEALSGQSGPEAQQQALLALDIELEGDEDEDDSEYDDDDPDTRLERIEETLEQQKAEAEQHELVNQENEYLQEGIEVLEEEADREFSDQEIGILASVARANRTDSGYPDLALAYDQLTALSDQQQKAWIASKKTSRGPGTGTAAQEAVDLSDPDSRIQYAAQRIAELAED